MLKSVRDRGFTLVELLVVIAIISVIAGFLIPTLMKARGKADIVKCQSNLREIQKLGMMFADTGGNRFYPFGKGKSPQAHESLNVLIKQSEGLKPSMFRCPTWREGEDPEIIDGKFQLDEMNCSYTWTKSRVSPSDPPNTAVSSDKYVWSEENKNGHPLGRNVVCLDNSVEFITTEQLPADELPRGVVR